MALMTLASTPTSAEMLARLVSFDTTSRNSNLALIDSIRAWLDSHGATWRESRNAAGDKANLHVMIGPQAAGGIALSGHVDTVPVDGQAWSSDPFTLRADGGKLYGRGAADMKGYVACFLAAVPELMAMKLARPVHLLITYDEEVDCAGARRLVADMQEAGTTPALCVVGEPSGMQPIIAHKGRLAARVRVRGLPGHSSAPGKGVNALFAASEAVAWIAAEARRHAAEGPFAEGFDPAYTTVHVGKMSGGTILNIIPEAAEFIMEYRNIPGVDPHAELERLRAFVTRAIEPAMKAVDPRCGFEVEALDWLPQMALPADHELAGLVKSATGSNSTGHVSYGTEGGIFQEAGIPTIVCGPGHIAQAHQPDEWIAQDQLDACDAFIRRLAGRLAD